MRDTTICLLSVFWDEEALCDRTATAIADGKVVGWFLGRMDAAGETFASVHRETVPARKRHRITVFR